MFTDRYQLPTWIVLFCLALTPLLAQETAPKKWHTGESFHRQLDSEIGISWSSEALRQKLSALSQHTQIAIWLDRRIDPSQQPELTISKTQLSQCFATIAEQINAGVSYIGPVVYIGPREVADRLATVAELRQVDVSKLPSDVRERMGRTKASNWSQLSTPQELLASAANDANVKILGQEKIPHDLWAGGDLPPLTIAQRLTLLLAGFDLTFEFDKSGKNIRLVPLPERPTISRTYTIRGDVDQVLGNLRSSVPSTTFTREASKIVAVGRFEDHQQIARFLQGNKTRAVAAGKGRTIYSMKGPSMLGTVLKTLQVQEGLNISLDTGAQAKLKDRVTFEVKDVSLDELLTTVLRDTGLKFQLNGKDLKVFAPQSPSTPLK